jgi:hypothetical protein
MSQTLFRNAVEKSLPAIAAGLSLVLFAGGSSAQTKVPLKQEPTAAPKISTLIRAGYTRPGSPNDLIKDGKVVALAGADDFKGRYLGGTVYFAVYEQSGLGASGDVYGTGYAGFDDLFKEGRASAGSYSPGFDTTAKYLYLYQVVNDRGLDPKGAATKNIRTEDIVSTTIKLLVDPSAISSWGHFTGTSFVSRVVDRDLKGKEQVAPDGKTEHKLLMSLSSYPSVLEALPYQEYLSLAPAISLHGLKNDFGVARSDLNLKNSKAHQELLDGKTKGVKLSSWQEAMFYAAKGGREPSYVQLLTTQPQGSGQLAAASFNGKVQPGLQSIGKNLAQGYVKVDWTGDQIIKLGEHSVVFGFTTNLPPGDEVLRLISAAQGAVTSEETVETGLADGQGPGVGPGQVVGPGTVPTPLGMHTAGQPSTSGYWLSGSWGMTASGGVSGGVLGGGVSGGFGGARAPMLGGGGSSGGGGGQNQPQSQFQNQTQTQDQTQDPGTTTNSGGGTDTGNVVPEPAAIALGLLGVPALLIVLWQRRRASLAQAAV